MDSNLIYLITGCIFFGIFSGLSSGLLGLGGGLVIVPVLNFLLPFAYPNIDPNYIIPIATQTSLGVIIFNTLISFIRQIKYNNVYFYALKLMAPSLILGAITVGIFVAHVQGGYLKVFFALIASYLAYRMIIGVKRKDYDISESNVPVYRTLGFGYIFGILSTLAGIGGGGFITPYFNQGCKLPIKKSLGTASACSFFVGLSGFLSYLISGIHQGVDTGIPFSFGYLNFIAFFSFLLTSVVSAGYGVKLQNILPAKTVKKIFAVFLIIISLDMLISGLRALHYL